ncbi:MAG: DUF4136 domain-containing protein [Planctomycetota bacterium]
MPTTFRVIAAAAVAASAAVLLAGCSSGPSVRAETLDADALRSARTLGAAEAGVAAPPGVPAEVSEWVVAAVTRELGDRGYRTGPEPDLLGRAFVAVDDQVVEFVNWDRFNWGEGSYVYAYQEGELVIEFVDARTGDLVWRGMAEGVVNADAVKADIDDAVAAMFERWPTLKG